MVTQGFCRSGRHGRGDQRGALDRGQVLAPPGQPGGRVGVAQPAQELLEPRCSLRGDGGGTAAVCGQQVGNHDRPRPPVDRDVVTGHDQAVHVISGPYHREPHRPWSPQIERRPPLVLSDALRRPTSIDFDCAFAHVEFRPRHLDDRGHHRHDRTRGHRHIRRPVIPHAGPSTTAQPHASAPHRNPSAKSSAICATYTSPAPLSTPTADWKYNPANGASTPHPRTREPQRKRIQIILGDHGNPDPTTEPGTSDGDNPTGPRQPHR